MKRKEYLISGLTGIGFLLALWIFSDAAEGSSVSMILTTVYLAALVLLTRRVSSWDTMSFSLLSQLVVFVGYKLLSVVDIIKCYRQDGFLGDYEVGPHQTMDIFFLMFLLTTFLMVALLRFGLARKKIRQIPKKTLKMIGIGIVVFVILGIADVLSWNIVNPYTEKLDDYCQTFSQEKWEQYAPKRELMLADFLAEHKGISEQELTKLLGKPEKEDGYFVGYGGQGEIYAQFVFEKDCLQDVNLTSISPFEKEV